MNLKININFLEKYFANLVTEIEYKRIKKKLNEYDLMADVDDQRSHHFYSWISSLGILPIVWFWFIQLFNWIFIRVISFYIAYAILGAIAVVISAVPNSDIAIR